MRRMLAAIACAAVFAASAQQTELLARLPLLAPRVVTWAKALEARALASGVRLDERLVRLARATGVKDPARVRLLVVDRIPLPDERDLQAAALSAGLSQSWASGLTVGHAVLVLRGFENDPRVLSHELRHVAQYESMGGIEPFLAKHLVDLAEVGYEASPFEADARAHERATFTP